jgi:AhpC/TSA family
MQSLKTRQQRAARRVAAAAFVTLFALNCAAVAATAPYGVDLDGHPVMLARSTAPAIVLFFTASDCPIANRYEPELMRLEQKFGPSGVEFWWVYPNPGDSAEVIRQHRSQFTGSSHIIVDVDQSLVHLTHVTVTPEAAILIPDNGTLREIYRGRIDDRYISFGQERPRALHNELENAISAVLAKQTLAKPGGPPVGCSIVPLEIRSQ